MPLTIVDSSCLVGLERIGRLRLLFKTCSEVVVPEAVAEEVGELPEGLSVQRPENRALVRSLAAHLGAGESEVIALAAEREKSTVILDDGPARQTAREMNLRLTGTMGLLIQAKRQGHLDRVRPLVDALAEADFRLSESLYERTLRLAGER